MYTYWTRRPITKAVQVNSLPALQHWVDSLSAEDKTEGSAFIYGFLVSSPTSSTWHLDYTRDDGTGAVTALYVESVFGDYVVLSPGSTGLFAQTAEDFNAAHEPTAGV